MKLHKISSEYLQDFFKKELPNIQFFRPYEYLYDHSFNYWINIEYTNKKNLIEQIKKISYMLNPLLTILDAVRIHYKKPVIITSAIRDLKLLNKIIDKYGGSVSKTTDHSYGLNYNFRGVGALDHYVLGIPIYEVYEYEKNNFFNFIGQLICYKKSMGNFNHISNVRTLMYSEDFTYKILPEYKKFIILGITTVGQTGCNACGDERLLSSMKQEKECLENQIETSQNAGRNAKKINNKLLDRK